MSKYKLNKRCITCNRLLLDRNKSGFCNIHRDRTGKNNPFFGKKHTKQTIDIIKIKNSEISKARWKDDEYRNKVISGVSKPRKESFKKEQSERILQWYKDNPVQKELRSEHMKNSWKKGLIPKSKNNKMNKSKMQKSFFELLKSVYPFAEEDVTLKINGRWFFPDVIIQKDGVIIEFLGDYWHANPDIYGANDIIHHGVSALDIWNNDTERIRTMETLGYTVYKVWENEYKKDKEGIIHRLDMILNWEGCVG